MEDKTIAALADLNMKADKDYFMNLPKVTFLLHYSATELGNSKYIVAKQFLLNKMNFTVQFHQSTINGQ